MLVSIPLKPIWDCKWMILPKSLPAICIFCLGGYVLEQNSGGVELASSSVQNLTIHSAVYHHYLDRSWTKLNGFRDGTDLHQLLQAPPSGQSAVYLSILCGEEDGFESDQYLQIGTNHRVFHSFGAQSKVQWKRYGENVESTLEVGLRYHGDHVVRLHTEVPYVMQNAELVRSDLETETLLDSTAVAMRSPFMFMKISFPKYISFLESEWRWYKVKEKTSLPQVKTLSYEQLSYQVLLH